MTLAASDPDGAAVRYSFQNEPPAGLTLDPVTGEIRWTPTEEQGPGTYPLIVRATEQSSLGQTAQATFSILVREAHTTPTLAPLPRLTRFHGDAIQLTPVSPAPALPPPPPHFPTTATPPGTPPSEAPKPDPPRGHWTAS